MRFVHFADVHLGNTQYGLDTRAEDFARAYHDAINYCEDVAPDFVLLAGDLFEHHKVDPSTFRVAKKGLERLRRKEIPVFAIEGNHDKPARQGVSSWLWYLNREGFIHLLDIVPDIDGGFLLNHWNPNDGRGAYFDLDGVRIFGIGYYGARLPSILSTFEKHAAIIPAKGINHSICMLHTGIDDVVDYNQSGATASSLSPLANLVDYVALGHIHHRFEIQRDDNSTPWIYNPGSFETCSALEAGREKGLYDVQLNGDKGCLQATHVSDPIFRRPYYRFAIDIDGMPSPETLQQTVLSYVSARIESSQIQPMLALTLSGTPQFDRGLLDTDQLQNIISKKFDCLHTRIRLEAQSRQANHSSDVGEAKTRHQIERIVLSAHFKQKPHYAKKADKLASLAIQIRHESIDGNSSEAILATLKSEIKNIIDCLPIAEEDLDATSKP